MCVLRAGEAILNAEVNETILWLEIESMYYYQGSFSEFYERISNPHDADMKNGRGDIYEYHMFLARMRSKGVPLCEKIETHIKKKLELERD